MIHITDLMTCETQASYRIQGKECFLPYPPMPFFSWRNRLRDAWEVFCNRAVAVNFR